MSGVKHSLATVVTLLAMNISTANAIPALPNSEERTQKGLCLGDCKFTTRVGYSSIHNLSPTSRLFHFHLGTKLLGFCPVGGSSPGLGTRQGGQYRRVQRSRRRERCVSGSSRLIV